MRGRIAAAGAAVALALACGVPASAASTPAHAARSCSAGFVKGTIGGREKCLHAGEFCNHRYASQYPRYGFHCVRRSRGNYYYLTG